MRTKKKEKISNLLKEAIRLTNKIKNHMRRLDDELERAGFESFLSCYHSDSSISIFDTESDDIGRDCLYIYLRRGKLSFENKGLPKETFKALKDLIKSLEKKGGV